MSLRSLLIRADASVAIGAGHVMRCMALAQAWQGGGGRAVFAAAQIIPAVARKLQEEGFEVVAIGAEIGSKHDAVRTQELARERHAEWVVVDGYQFDSEYQARIKDAGFRLLFLDDVGRRGRYSADIILNQNIHAREEIYADREQHTRCLLGPGFALLRR